MPCVNQCCCCSLRTGGFILGWLGTVDAIFRAVGVIVLSVYMFTGPTDIFGNLDKAGRTGICALSVMSVGVSLAINILLLIASDKKKHLYVLPWLIVNGLQTFGGLLAILIIGGILLSASDVVPYTVDGSIVHEGPTNFYVAGVIIYIIGIPISCISIYFWICMLSLFQSIRNENASGNIIPMGSVPYSILKV